MINIKPTQSDEGRLPLRQLLVGRQLVDDGGHDVIDDRHHLAPAHRRQVADGGRYGDRHGARLLGLLPQLFNQHFHGGNGVALHEEGRVLRQVT